MSCHTTMSHGKTYIVRRLDGFDQDVTVDKKATGGDLLDKVCKTVGILEKDYFGLLHPDKNGDRFWLNLRNPLPEQLPPGVSHPILEMKVKYFVSPQRLMQPVTRLYFYKHLRKELILGRLKIGSARAARLTALIAQVDSGDYHQMFKYRHKVPCSSAEMDNYDMRIQREHHKLVGMPVEVAVEKFLSEAASLEHYGVEMYPAINGKGSKVVFGVGPEYIFIYSQQLDVLHRFSYNQVQYTAFHGRKFTAMVHSQDNSKQPSQMDFELKSRGAAQALYRCVTEFHTFFQRETVSSVIKTAGYCKSLIGSFKGQSPDRFYFDVARTHREVVDYLWPVLHPNSPQIGRPLPPPLPSATSMMSVASQRSTRSLPAHNPNRLNSALPRSVSTDGSFRRVHGPGRFHVPPPDTPVHQAANPPLPRRNHSRRMPPPPSPFNPYASSIDGNSSDSDDQSLYVGSTGEPEDMYVCMRSSDTFSPRHCDVYTDTSSETYINSGTSEISSASLEQRIASPPPVYSEIDPNQQEIPSPCEAFTPSQGSESSMTINGILNGGGSNNGMTMFNFDASSVLARTRELENELSRLRSAMTCRMCKSNPISATFCPCGHTICCLSCASRASSCWECHQPVNTVQRMLLA